MYTLQFHLVGIVFNLTKKRGVKRKSSPSPEDVEFLSQPPNEDVLEKGKPIFFDDEIPLSSLIIAASDGCKIESWAIRDFYDISQVVCHILPRKGICDNS